MLRKQEFFFLFTLFDLYENKSTKKPNLRFWVLSSMNSKKEISIFWFRRDLRLEDNVGLYNCLQQNIPVLPLFIFDKNILDKLEDKTDKRLSFIHKALSEIDETLKAIGSGLKTLYDNPIAAFEQLAKEYNIKSVFFNHDYEPYAIKRDKELLDLLALSGTSFLSFKDQVIFEKDEVMAGGGQAYTVFTPYSKKWKSQLNNDLLNPKDSSPYFGNFLKWEGNGLVSLSDMGFNETENQFPSPEVKEELIRDYAEKRNFPFLPATSKLSVHLRFGTISIRKLVQLALKNSETWLNELIWREFYMNILYHFPRVGQGKAFKPAYDLIPWRQDPEAFQKWCDGKTGYPIVDAGMRELNETGFMHNRVRMIVASFLVKHLLIDWRLGEAYFAKKLLDYDLSANNGGWQWAAGSGCDAAPYFRVFNPTLQTEKFDKEMKYIKKWVPEYNSLTYMQNQIVNHEFARKRVLDVYKTALAASK